jgi:MiaB-like tRNA modifying enzyme
MLTTGGHLLVDAPETAELAVLFSCCVIETTELKMLRRARLFSELGLPLVVSGCMSVIRREAFDKAHSEVYFLEPPEIIKINSLIDEISENKQTILKESLESGATRDLVKPLSTGGLSNVVGVDTSDIAGEFESIEGESIDSIVPIATGCMGQCTYCITRLARGELRSYPEEQIIQNISSAVSAGHYEVRLTAQDTGCYGFDTNSNLPSLLAGIVELDSENEFRVRVGMMNPDSVRSILNELLEGYRNPRIFKFLHIPVQSGNDELLAAMGRRYTVAEFMKIIDNFREVFPQLTISTDIIIGYPNETDEQFQHSMELLERLQPNIVNITRFSARPGTPAAKLKNTLAGSTVKARSRAMTALRFRISKELNVKEIGKQYRILVTERVKAGSVLGRTDNYQPVVVKSGLELGSWVEVRIVDSTDAYLIGELVM